MDYPLTSVSSVFSIIYLYEYCNSYGFTFSATFILLRLFGFTFLFFYDVMLALDL